MCSTCTLYNAHIESHIWKFRQSIDVSSRASVTKGFSIHEATTTKKIHINSELNLHSFQNSCLSLVISMFVNMTYAMHSQNNVMKIPICRTGNPQSMCSTSGGDDQLILNISMISSLELTNDSITN